LQDARIRWQCRRGTRELDHLLTGWFNSSYATASDAHKSAFCALLELQDPDLIAYLLGAATPRDAHMADVVNSIRNRTATC
jgi:antitoxin CptB